MVDTESVNDRRGKAYNYLSEKRWGEARDEFEQIFDGTDAAIATCLGFIYDQKDTPFCDPDRAEKYYRISAEKGDTYAQYALGGLLLAKGEKALALAWYKQCSSGGNANCSYIAYQLYKERKEEQESEAYFRLAFNQGHPIAVQKRSLEYMKGKFGLHNVAVGLFMYLRNIPTLTRFVRENIQ